MLALVGPPADSTALRAAAAAQTASHAAPRASQWIDRGSGKDGKLAEGAPARGAPTGGEPARGAPADGALEDGAPAEGALGAGAVTGGTGPRLCKGEALVRGRALRTLAAAATALATATP